MDYMERYQQYLKQREEQNRPQPSPPTPADDDDVGVRPPPGAVPANVLLLRDKVDNHINPLRTWAARFHETFTGGHFLHRVRGGEKITPEHARTVSFLVSNDYGEVNDTLLTAVGEDEAAWDRMKEHFDQKGYRLPGNVYDFRRLLEDSMQSNFGRHWRGTLTRDDESKLVAAAALELGVSLAEPLADHKDRHVVHTRAAAMERLREKYGFEMSPVEAWNSLHQVRDHLKNTYPGASGYIHRFFFNPDSEIQEINKESATWWSERVTGKADDKVDEEALRGLLSEFEEAKNAAEIGSKYLDFGIGVPTTRDGRWRLAEMPLDKESRRVIRMYYTAQAHGVGLGDSQKVALQNADSTIHEMVQNDPGALLSRLRENMSGRDRDVYSTRALSVGMAQGVSGGMSEDDWFAAEANRLSRIQRPDERWRSFLSTHGSSDAYTSFRGQQRDLDTVRQDAVRHDLVTNAGELAPELDHHIKETSRSARLEQERHEERAKKAMESATLTRLVTWTRGAIGTAVDAVSKVLPVRQYGDLVWAPLMQAAIDGTLNDLPATNAPRITGGLELWDHITGTRTGVEEAMSRYTELAATGKAGVFDDAAMLMGTMAWGIGNLPGILMENPAEYALYTKVASMYSKTAGAAVRGLDKAGMPAGITAALQLTAEPMRPL